MRKRKFKGLGEILGFCYIVPFIVMLICAIIASAQITLASQRLTFAAYSTCRAAVVAEKEDLAKERGEAILKSLYGTNFNSLQFVKESTTLGEAYDDNEVNRVIEYVGTEAKWIKGDMIKCTVYQKITPLMPFTSGVRAQSVIMMIECGELPNPYFN